MSRSDNSSPAPDGATLTEYTLTIEATCTATVVVKSTSPIKAGKWLRDVAIPNQLVDHGKLHYRWDTASVTWDDGDEESSVPEPDDAQPLTLHTLTMSERARAIEAAPLIDIEQLRNWIRYPSGGEATIDAMGYAQDMAAIGRAAFRHRVATDPAAAAECVEWDGDPPRLDLAVCPTMGGACDPSRCSKRGCQR